MFNLCTLEVLIIIQLFYISAFKFFTLVFAVLDIKLTIYQFLMKIDKLLKVSGNKLKLGWTDVFHCFKKTDIYKPL